MVIIAIVSLIPSNGVFFRIFYTVFAIFSAIELISFHTRSRHPQVSSLIIIELALLIGSCIFVIVAPVRWLWFLIIAVPSCDIFAYLFGITIGGKIIRHSRPFPHISKNKTWEGTILGIAIATTIIATVINFHGDFATDWVFLLVPALGVAGDIIESYIKRKSKIKDSNEIVIKNPLFAKFEIIVGGKNGHGGFLDRIDSLAFTASVLLILSLTVVR